MVTTIVDMHLAQRNSTDYRHVSLRTNRISKQTNNSTRESAGIFRHTIKRILYLCIVLYLCIAFVIGFVMVDYKCVRLDRNDLKERLPKLEIVQPKPTDGRSTTYFGGMNFPTVVCPEIQEEENNVSIDINEISITEVQEAIFQLSKVKVETIVKKRNAASGKFDKQAFEETLTDVLVLDKYIYAPGGHWIPKECLPRWKVAIIIPFKDRYNHLPILLNHLIPFLQRQHLEFGIFVAEQINDIAWNKGMLMNIAFLEVLNFSSWDCFIFHDVDLIPLSYANYYGCSHMPRHFLSGLDKWNYTLDYELLFGGVTGFTSTQIQKFNGFPNVYWDWGGEDDDIFYRLRKRGFSRTRPWGATGFYNSIPHNHSKNNNPKRYCLLKNFAQRAYTDGLNNLYYSTPNVTFCPLYINISVLIQELEWNKEWSTCLAKRMVRINNNKKKT